MLKTKFWSGLKNYQIREASRIKCTSTSRFNDLLVELRRIEKEFEEHDRLKKGYKAQHNAQSVGDDIVIRIERESDDLSGRVVDLKDNQLQAAAPPHQGRRDHSRPSNNCNNRP